MHLNAGIFRTTKAYAPEELKEKDNLRDGYYE